MNCSLRPLQFITFFLEPRIAEGNRLLPKMEIRTSQINETGMASAILSDPCGTKRFQQGKKRWKATDKHGCDTDGGRETDSSADENPISQMKK